MRTDQNPPTASSPDERRARRQWLMFTIHQVIAAVGVGFAANIILNSILPRQTALAILLYNPLSPAQIALGLLAGFALTVILPARSAEWVWVLPLAIAVIAFLLTPVPLGERLQHFFGLACQPGPGCIARVGVVVPFYSAAAYSFGALAAARVGLLRRAMQSRV